VLRVPIAFYLLSFDHLHKQQVEQPMCSDVATGFYVFCITIPEDPQDLVFMVHPTIPSGTALRDIPDSVNAQNALPIIYDSVNECTAIGELILATYQWDNSAGGDGSDEVLKTSLLQEFTYNRFFRASETIACGIQVNEEDI